ncbi:GntR family transcriptional regulator [Pseudonocardia sp. KRD-184]|uniref:GntR family transcriptional regulator n=1 Tax=Pseudonocardia oceani TaxID=2792013 RepID=A0ABS6U3H4_9PSEU|nr:GntR family transcriptional regulator [Pseudonocardia oceani]MBW0092007.1 GntR family transcriptional regulator [Pseudonocardia oceani]MBW0099606.1 GntR family transcriptional regulator [Pseudonocardia oceani]MBW0112335.1 GntR family transcriptional regulator [Pseudonocardia oceani]MBW0123957.1 GntR family transcriptional regulator [Pseudonocardia oceani]MBW0126786.1 GntR family transcriptional regulator [Pseudonocardia oceani]
MTGARSLDRARHDPLWSQLLADLRRRLDAGEFADAFPGELVLVGEYGVSRHTVREALRRLRDEGTVVAGRGRSPRLAEPAEIRQPLGALYSLFSSVEAAGLSQRSVVRTLEVRADGVIAARLGLEESTPLVFLERLRMAGTAPLAVDRVWLPHAIAAPLLDVDFTHTALYAELARACGITLTAGREDIRAVVPSEAERDLLAVGPDVAAFAIERLGLVGSDAVEWRHTLVRGDRFTVTADFSTRGGYRLGLAR